MNPYYAYRWWQMWIGMWGEIGRYHRFYYGMEYID